MPVRYNIYRDKALINRNNDCTMKGATAIAIEKRLLQQRLILRRAAADIDAGGSF